jgi:UDP-3-O-[3-hydroxymyristoyl] glucosamine N-acyltransferase
VKESTIKTVAELAQVVQGRVHGDPDVKIRGIATIQDARTGDITFAETTRFLQEAQDSPASAILVPTSSEMQAESMLHPAAHKVLIQVENPKFAFAQLLNLFDPGQHIVKGIHETAVCGSDFRYGANLSLGAHCVVGENVRIGSNVIVHPLAYLGDDVEIGDDCVIHPNVTLLRGTIIGSRTTIHSGTVVGADGFGYLMLQGKHHKIPQIGHVAIGDDVEIGAKVTIDRARTGATRIGNGTKIDNQVHIGHNCQIGEHVILVAQVGLAGGVEVGDYTVIAGQTGVIEQIKIGARSVVGANSSVYRDVPEGSFVSGYPTRPHKQTLRVQAATQQLPELLKQFKALEKRLLELENELKEVKGETP